MTIRFHVFWVMVCLKWEEFLPFKDRVMIYCMSLSYFLNLFILQMHLGCFGIMATVNTPNQYRNAFISSRSWCVFFHIYIQEGAYWMIWYLFKKAFLCIIYLFKKEREISHQLAHSLSSQKIQGAGGPEWGRRQETEMHPRSALWVSGTQQLKPSLVASQGTC